MQIEFYISGSLVCTATSSIVPTIGSEVEIRMETYKKGMGPGTVLSFRVSEEFPPCFDYVTGVVRIDVNEWTVMSEGAKPQES